MNHLKWQDTRPTTRFPGYNRNWITTYALAHRYQTAGILMKNLEQVPKGPSSWISWTGWKIQVTFPILPMQ